MITSGMLRSSHTDFLSSCWYLLQTNEAEPSQHRSHPQIQGVSPKLHCTEVVVVDRMLVKSQARSVDPSCCAMSAYCPSQFCNQLSYRSQKF